MSILDALKVQKANQQSVSELAALPQNEIVRLAQMGQIPADVVPVVISEKARMAKEMANLQAAQQMQQQGGKMPTVIEQAMQANAQAEAPQVPQQQPGLPSAMPGAQAQAPMQMPPQGAAPQGAPAEPGVAGLPTGDMFNGQSFEAGGIVAFAGKGPSLVKSQDEFAGLDEAIARAAANPAQQVMTEDQAMAALQGEAAAPAPGSGPSSLAEFIQQYRDLTSNARVESPEEIAYREAVKKGSMSQGDIDQQKYMRLLQAGLGIMGGDSPYAFTNIGKGSQEALKGYSEDLAAQRASKMLDLKTAAESARTRRGEELQDIQGGAKLYESYLDRELKKDIAKESQLGAKYADNYLAMKKAGGDQRPDEVIRDEGYRTFFQEYGFASGRAATQANIAAGSQGVQTTGQEQTARSTAVKEFNDLKMSDPIKREYNRLASQDKKNKEAGNPTNLAETYKNQQIGSMEQRILGNKSQNAAPAPAPAGGGGQAPDISKIKGAPSGSKVGAFVQGKGWEIRGKDGTLLGYAPVKK